MTEVTKKKKVKDKRKKKDKMKQSSGKEELKAKKKKSAKKRKRSEETEKPSKQKKKKKDGKKASKTGAKKKTARDKTPQNGTSKKARKDYTVSIALPGSIVMNAQTRELQTYLSGQIGRAIAIFKADEVVVFDDGCTKSGKQEVASMGEHDRSWNPNVFLARVLQYLETPQYLRKAFFPMHKDLRFAGLLNPLDAPHHMRASEVCQYREGVTVKRPVIGRGSWVHVGLRKPIQVDKHLNPNVRVTVKLDLGSGTPSSSEAPQRGTLVSPGEPRRETGTYWGYSTRLAASLSDVWGQCPYEGGYDMSIGTSDKGTSCIHDADFKIPPFKHLIVVFGGLAGIEDCVANDDRLDVPADQTSSLFDMYVNTCPGQGSRTIRSEEAILISMARFQQYVERAN